MDSKVELYDKLLCMGCLCVEQPLQAITEPKLHMFYKESLNEIPVEPPDMAPSMCWECADMLTKVVAFREQVKDSYKTLLTYPDENLHEYLGDSAMENDTLIDKKPGELDGVFIKEEIKNEYDIDIDIDEPGPLEDKLALPLSDDMSRQSDNEAGHEMETPVSDCKKEKEKEKQPKKKKKRPKDGDPQKIVHVELTFEEMMTEREADKTRPQYLRAAYKCNTCVLGFSYKQSYCAHVQTKHAPDLGDYVCPVCQTIVSSLDAFTAHYKRHIKRYECGICRKRTADMRVMHQHYYSAHDVSLRQYQCEECGKISKSIHAHRYHRDSHKARVECNQCDNTFSHRAGLLNHRLAMHGKRVKHPCASCGKVFRWKASLQRHLKRHRAPDGQPAAEAFCASCDIKFASVASYHRHLKNSLKHVMQEDLKYVCDHCKRRFADKTKLRDHIEEKHLFKTYQCHICNKPSKNRVGLDQHIRNVHKGRPNDKMCHHCGKGFPTKIQLESHIRTHTGERPFICEYCPTTFTQQSNLNKHNRQVHQNIKPKRSPAKKPKEETQTSTPAVDIPTPNHQTIEPLHQTPVVSLHYTPEGFVM